MDHAQKIKGFEDHCMKGRSNNIFLCTEKKRKAKFNKVVEFMNKKMSGHACCRSKKKRRKSRRGRRFRKKKKT